MNDLPAELAGIPRPIVERLKCGDFSSLDQQKRACLGKWLPKNRKTTPPELFAILDAWWTASSPELADKQGAHDSDRLRQQYQTWLEGYVSPQGPTSPLAGESTDGDIKAHLLQVWAKLKALDQRTGGQYSALYELRSRIVAVLTFETGERVLSEASDETEASNWTDKVDRDIRNLKSRVDAARSRLCETKYVIPEEWLVADVRLFIESRFWRRPPRGLSFGEWVVKVAGPRDCEATWRVLREIDAAILRLEHGPESKADPPAPANVSIQAGAVNVKAPRVRVPGTPPPASASPETGGSSNAKGGPAAQATATAGDTIVHTHIHLDQGAVVETVLKRLVEQQAAAPSGREGDSPAAGADEQKVAQPAAPSGTRPRRRRRGEWPVTRTEREVARYLSERMQPYWQLGQACLDGKRGAVDRFQKVFGPTAIADGINQSLDVVEKAQRCKKQDVLRTSAYEARVQPLTRTPPCRPEGWRTSEDTDSGAQDILEDIHGSDAP